jgi:hypothetical protein
MVDMIRHVGKIANTDERCVIAFMQIPNREDHALVIPTDTLPPRYEQAVMDVLKSAEGQNEECFGVALSRRLMPDTGKDIFATLHDGAMLRAVPCSRVLMLPLPNQPIKLTDILIQLGRHVRGSDDTMRQEQLDKFNPHMNNMRANTAEAKRGIGENLLLEARMLEHEAKKKRDLAYSHDPSLRPNEVVANYVVPGVLAPMESSERIADPAQLSMDELLK